MFFSNPRFVSIPSSMHRPLDIGMRCIFGSLTVMFVGMILASLWQWAFGIQATSLMESPVLFQLMMVVGFVAFLISLGATLIGISIWNKIKQNNIPWF